MIQIGNGYWWNTARKYVFKKVLRIGLENETKWWGFCTWSVAVFFFWIFRCLSFYFVDSHHSLSGVCVGVVLVLSRSRNIVSFVRQDSGGLVSSRVVREGGGQVRLPSADEAWQSHQHCWLVSGLTPTYTSALLLTLYKARTYHSPTRKVFTFNRSDIRCGGPLAIVVRLKKFILKRSKSGATWKGNIVLL